MKRGFAGFALVLALDRSADAFTAFPSARGSGACSNAVANTASIVSRGTGLAMKMTNGQFSEDHSTTSTSSSSSSSSSGSVRRGEFIATAAASIGLAVLSTAPAGARASVNFETERYGDKELKIATVNKLRQQIRNSLLEDPKLAPEMLKLAIADALGFDASTQTGGPDGSVLLEMDRPISKSLKPAVDNALKIKRNLQRTNEMTLADVVAMGGAEAIHAVGGPNILVQIGRYDEKKEGNPAPDIPGFNFEAPTAAGVKAAFKRAGLGPREMTLLLGAIGSVADTTASLKPGGEDGDEDDLEDLGWQNSIPNTFGKESDKLGKALSSGFGPGFLKRVAEGGKDLGTAEAVGKCLAEDEEVKSFVKKYAGNTKAFSQDLSEAYTKMTLLGSRYETRNAGL